KKCNTGEILKKTNSGWECADDEKKGGDIPLIYGSEWIPAKITDGLGKQDRKTKPTVFNMDGKWYLITQKAGFEWDDETSQWHTNNDIIKGIASVGKAPTVFNMDGEWYLITGRLASCDYGFLGYKWNSTKLKWDTDDSIVNGLTGSCAQGNNYYITIFEINKDWYAIRGDWNRNSLIGYKWSGSKWIKNHDMDKGLNDGIGDYCSPMAFNMNNELYLIVGNEAGEFHGYKWSGSKWIRSTNIVAGLEDFILRGLLDAWVESRWNCEEEKVDVEKIDVHITPNVFNMNGNLYLISGDAKGMFYGYIYNVIEEE
ncbi:MAG: hypothetical protein B6U87_02720, partial [Candidatus Aenigmarchaeota archaeon ex4484_52]